MQASWYVIAYDIRDKKRLQKLYRLLKKHAQPLQASVFLYTATQKQKQTLAAKIIKIIDTSEDDVRIYQASRNGQFISFGRSLIPDGCIDFSAPNWQHTPIEF